MLEWVKCVNSVKCVPKRSLGEGCWPNRFPSRANFRFDTFPYQGFRHLELLRCRDMLGSRNEPCQPHSIST